MFTYVLIVLHITGHCGLQISEDNHYAIFAGHGGHCGET